MITTNSMETLTLSALSVILVTLSLKRDSVNHVLALLSLDSHVPSALMRLLVMFAREMI